MSSKRSTSHHRPYRLQEIALGTMVTSPKTQRELKQHRVDELLANFDLDMFGHPAVSWRSGKHFIIDGQHRIEALKLWLGKGWEIQKIECRVYQGLSESEEADMFDRLNNVLIVSSFDKFRIRVTAGREAETAIDQIVKEEKLVISRDKIPGAIGAVGTLVRVYSRSDGEVLARSLRIIRDAFGDAGFESQVIDGIGHLCQRYNGALEEQVVVEKLAETRGGVKGLLGKATILHKQTGNSQSQCVAAAAVDIINSHKGGKKLPSWWKTSAHAANDPQFHPRKHATDDA
jgi:hypothetical protein